MDTADRTQRRLGAAVAFGVALASPVILIVASNDADLAGVVGLLGVVSAVPLGWKLGPWAARASRGEAVLIGTLLMGVGVIAIGDLIAAAVLAISAGTSAGADGGPLSGLTGFIAGFVLLGLLGATFVGVQAALLTVPSGLVWAAAVRWLARAQGGDAPKAAPIATNSGWAGSISTSHDASRSWPDDVANV